MLETIFRRNKLKDQIFEYIKNHTNIIEFEKILRSNNIDMNWRNDQWKTPLHLACELHLGVAWINLLIRYGADINRLTLDNKTALHYVCENNDTSVASLLIKLKANINGSDNNGETPLKIAIRNEWKELINLIVSRNRDLNNTRHRKAPKSVDMQNKRSGSKNNFSKQNFNYDRSLKRLSHEELSTAQNFNKFKNYSKFVSNSKNPHTSTKSKNLHPSNQTHRNKSYNMSLDTNKNLNTSNTLK